MCIFEVQCSSAAQNFWESSILCRKLLLPVKDDGPSYNHGRDLCKTPTDQEVLGEAGVGLDVGSIPVITTSHHRRVSTVQSEQHCYGQIIEQKEATSE